MTKTRTRPTSVKIEIRRAPRLEGQPDYIRIDSVHQGDLDREKGLYYLNAVDCVTQWELVACCAIISEAFLLCSEAVPSEMVLALLIYGYATGTLGSRRLEQATYDSLVFRYIAANSHPDHATLCTFRKRFLPEIERLFVEVLGIAQQMKRLKLGTIALNGTQIHANAARHSALSYGHAQKIEAQANETGKKPRGKPPLPPSAGPRATDQVNLTDPESRVIPVVGGGFEQCYNAQAAVETDLPSPPHWPRRQPSCCG